MPRPTPRVRLPPPASSRPGRRSRWSPPVRPSTAIWRRRTRFWAARASRHRTSHCSQLRRIRPRHRADVARVRQFVQHHFRRIGQQDAAARADAGRHQYGMGRTTRSTASARSPDRCRRQSIWPSAPRTVRPGQGVGHPFGMAMVAATVAAGKTPVPQLIEGRPTAITGDTTPISAEDDRRSAPDDAVGGHQRHR